jgi:hypothetical protein
MLCGATTKKSSIILRYRSDYCHCLRLLTHAQDDPYQTVNLAADVSQHESYRIANRPLPQIFQRTNALMMVLKSCSGDSCRNPWAQLHPNGDVHSLADALDKSYDTFYANQPKVSFSECSLGYHLWAEGPQKFNVYKKGSRDVDDGQNGDEDSSTSALNLSDM